MLKLKLKEILLAQGKLKPQAWLQTYCGFTQAKAHNLINLKQKSIAFADLSKICAVLNCTPDELFWWDNTKRGHVDEGHPCRVKLIAPSKDANWTKRIGDLNPDRVDALKKFMEKLETEKDDERNIIKETNPPPNEENLI